LSSRPAVAALVCGGVLFTVSVARDAAAAPVVNGANVHVVLTSPTSCDVEAAYTIQVDRPEPIPFTLQTFDGTHVELVSVNGAAVASADLQHSGKTTIFSARPAVPGTLTTNVRYRVTQTSEWSYRCPIWLPAVPTARRPGGVAVQVELPAGVAVAGTTMPPLRRTQSGGVASLSHIPSFVRVPFLAPGEPRSGVTGWDVSRIVDVATIVVLLGSSLVWLALRERRRRRTPAVARGS
jgi:hypothetical protein